MIVVSILLAFAIDAGWEELHDREQEQRLLMQLSDELDLYFENLGPASKRVTDRVPADIEHLLGFIHGASDVDEDDLLDALSWLHRAYEFSSASPVTDRLSSASGLQQISSSAIRKNCPMLRPSSVS